MGDGVSQLHLPRCIDVKPIVYESKKNFPSRKKRKAMKNFVNNLNKPNVSTNMSAVVAGNAPAAHAGF